MNLEKIKECLKSTFTKANIKVEDLTGTGDHISVSIESIDFTNLSLIEQHKMVYKALGPSVGKELHAVAIHTSVPKNH
jgi:stress-induced morphogen